MKNKIEKIEQLKKERNAIVLAHVYQPAVIQYVADFTGDSLDLSRRAAETDADVIVFCGVHFMAETANLLSPDKITLLPEPDAGCMMANTITAEALAKKRAQKPDAAVVAYVNSPASVKAMSDVCCTSANAVRIVDSFPADRDIIFVPDQNLGAYVRCQTGRNIDCWPGACPIHNRLSAEEVAEAKTKLPDALVLAHPECPEPVLSQADFVGGTVGIVQFAKESAARAFIIATEAGVFYQMEKECPDKEFYLAAEHMVCRDMKYTTLESIKKALETLAPRVIVPEEYRERAAASLRKMLEICR